VKLQQAFNLRAEVIARRTQDKHREHCVVGLAQFNAYPRAAEVVNQEDRGVRAEDAFLDLVDRVLIILRVNADGRELRTEGRGSIRAELRPVKDVFVLCCPFELEFGDRSV